MKTPKEKALEYLKTKNTGFGDLDEVNIFKVVDIIKAIDIGIKEERGRIITLIISQECNTPQMATTQRKIINLICKGT